MTFFDATQTVLITGDISKNLYDPKTEIIIIFHQTILRKIMKKSFQI